MPKRIDSTVVPKVSDKMENISWYDRDSCEDHTYFTLINCNRRTIEEGEQVYSSFDSDNRSNYLMLKSFSFCPSENKFDYFEFYLKPDIIVESVLEPEVLVDWSMESKLLTTVRLEKDIINELLLAYLRTHSMKGYFEPKKDRKGIMVTRPRHLAYEQHVFSNYMKILVYLQETLNQVSTLEQDLEIL